MKKYHYIILAQKVIWKAPATTLSNTLIESHALGLACQYSVHLHTWGSTHGRRRGTSLHLKNKVSLKYGHSDRHLKVTTWWRCHMTMPKHGIFGRTLHGSTCVSHVTLVGGRCNSKITFLYQDRCPPPCASALDEAGVKLPSSRVAATMLFSPSSCSNPLVGPWQWSWTSLWKGLELRFPAREEGRCGCEQKHRGPKKRDFVGTWCGPRS
jgi:hypothetical protein